MFNHINIERLFRRYQSIVAQKNSNLRSKIFYYLRTNICKKIICLLGLHVPYHDIGISLLWRLEKDHADDGRHFFEIVKMSRLT